MTPPPVQSALPPERPHGEERGSGGENGTEPQCAVAVLTVLLQQTSPERLTRTLELSEHLSDAERPRAAA